MLYSYLGGFPFDFFLFLSFIITISYSIDFHMYLMYGRMQSRKRNLHLKIMYFLGKRGGRRRTKDITYILFWG